MSRLENVAGDFLSLLEYMRDKFFRPVEKMTRHRLSHAQFHAILHLYIKGPLPVSEFAREMKISKQQSTPLICKLIESGLVAKRADEHDRRIVRIELTETGRGMLEALWKELKQAFAVKLQALSGNELDELEQIMRRIREILQGIK